jgi:hypothetical protein
MQFDQCFFKNSASTIQVVLNNGVGVLFTNCAFESPTSALDLNLSSCFNVSLKDCYFEPANGIYADTCPGLRIESCVLVGVDFSGSSNSAFLRASTASAPGTYTLPIITSLVDCVFNGTATGTKYWANNDSGNAITSITNCYAVNNDLLRGAYVQPADVTNANGKTTFDASGRQIHTFARLGSGYGTIGNKTEAFTFSSNFSQTPSLSFLCTEPDTSTGRYSVLYATSTSSINNVTIGLNVSVAYTTSPSLSITATGRWY